MNEIIRASQSLVPLAAPVRHCHCSHLSSTIDLCQFFFKFSALLPNAPFPIYAGLGPGQSWIAS